MKHIAHLRNQFKSMDSFERSYNYILCIYSLRLRWAKNNVNFFLEVHYIAIYLHYNLNMQTQAQFIASFIYNDFRKEFTTTFQIFSSRSLSLVENIAFFYAWNTSYLNYRKKLSIVSYLLCQYNPNKKQEAQWPHYSPEKTLAKISISSIFFRYFVIISPWKGGWIPIN